jgi:hypothetical protein
LPANSIGAYGCSVAAGGYLVISELNDPIYVSSGSPQNPGGCTYCDVLWSGKREREQIVEIESVTGTGPYTVTISPALYTNYGVATGTAPAYATPFGALNGGTPDCKYCGVESLQIYANGTGLSSGMSDMNMTECAYCFVQNVEFNYTDADWLDMDYCFRCEVRNNYFFNAFGHGAGGSDADVQLAQETSASLVINNILERGHSSVIVDGGAAGNVIAYNYANGAFDAVGWGGNQLNFVEHGAYPQFNLFEGNVAPNFVPDSWHGNEGYNTVYRNWWTGSTTVATYPQEAITSGTCSGGSCTITWASGSSQFYAGQYVLLLGTNQVGCGTGTTSTPQKWAVYQMTGTSGSLSSTFAAGNCVSWTGGYALTLDLSAVPAPIAHTGSGALSWTSTYNTYQALWPISVPAFSTGNNIIGNVLGSSQMQATVGSAYMYNAGSGCTSCIQAPASRIYTTFSGVGANSATSSYNYDTSGDSTGGIWASFAGGPSSKAGYWSNQGFITTCYHENYDIASASTINNVNCSPATTLPASFFLSSKPSWFGNISWPAIGPDVTGGPDTATAGHANYIPAEVCYNNLLRDTTGAKLFDAGSCYGVTPPLGVTAVIK